MLKLYNTLTNTEQEFHKQPGEEVLVYTCGPTVYGRAHIGNLSSFLLADLAVRLLEHQGYKVKHAKNITDVGHLVADDSADASGEDKIEKQARAEQIDPLQIAEKYTEQYLADERVLNFREPEHRPRATVHVPHMITLTKELLNKGIAYETDDGIYFNVEQFPDYGKLSGNTLQNLNAGARVDVNDQKKHPADFALWKKCVGENAHHLLRWSFATGKRVQGDAEDASAGFPGWHIECSAMTKECLGEHIDIHTGGEDNIFPHHECEIAQSESVYGKPMSQFWLHRRRIDLGDQKMSKSLGNVLTLDSIAEMGFSAQDLRYYLLSVHYRTQLKFTKEGLAGAAKARRRIMQWIAYVESNQMQRVSDDIADEVRSALPEFTEALENDLNTPAALAVIFSFMSYYNSKQPFTSAELPLLHQFINAIKQIFACFEPEETDVPAIVDDLLQKRQEARENKNFALSDQLRDEIKAHGFNVKDSSQGQELEPL